MFLKKEQKDIVKQLKPQLHERFLSRAGDAFFLQIL